MDGDNSVGADLAELRRVVEDLDPGKKGNLLAPKKLFGIIPFGNKLRNYFDSYKSSQNHINGIMGSLASGDALVAGPMLIDQDDVAEIQRELLDKARHDLASSLAALEHAGATATGDLVTVEPIDALAAKVKEVAAAEVIVLTRPHIVAEFFHLDWTSRARRKLGVPVLHLLEHENFDEQAGGGEGISGF